MADRPIPGEILAQDPLREVTRAERRNLLGSAAIAIFIAKTGLVPTRIAALGVEFTQAHQLAVLRVLAAIVAYFLLAFFIYCSADLIAWRVALSISVTEARRRRHGMTDEEKQVELDLMVKSIPRYGLSHGLLRPISVVRAVFEFGIPVAIAIYAFICLATASA